MRTKTRPTHIDPNVLYTWKGFQIASGISATRIREARLKGISLPALAVGRRKFVRGRDAIDYIEQLAKQSIDGMACKAHDHNIL